MIANSFRAGQICFPSKKSFSIIRDKVFITERSCATGIDFFHKAQASNFQRRPWSPLCSKANTAESLASSGWFNTILYFREERPWKPTWDETRWPSAQNNNKQAEVLLLKRGRDENSVHLQVLQILHIHGCKFWDWNTFLSSQVLNSTSEKMSQKRRVFEFWIQGRLCELSSHDCLSIFGPITVEINLGKPIKFTCSLSQSRAFAIRSPLAFLPCLQAV